MSAQWTHVQEALRDLDFPATKEEIVRHAEGYGDRTTVRMARALPLATYRNMGEIRSSVPLDPAQDEGLTPADEVRRARSPHDHRIAQHLRDVP